MKSGWCWRERREALLFYVWSIQCYWTFMEKKNTTTLKKTLGEFFRVFPLKKLFSLRKGDGDSISKHLNAFNTIVTQLISVGVNMDEEDHRMTLLWSLSYSWDNLVMAIRSIVKTLVFDEVVVVLLLKRWGGKLLNPLMRPWISVEERRKEIREKKKANPILLGDRSLLEIPR